MAEENENMHWILCMGERAYFPYPSKQFAQDTHNKQLVHLVEEDGDRLWHYQATGDPFDISTVSIPAADPGEGSVYTIAGDIHRGKWLLGGKLLGSNAYHDPEESWPDYISDPDLQVPADKVKLKTELVKDRYQAELDENKAVQDALRQSVKDAQGNDYACLQAINSAYLDVAKGQIDRSQARATQVITAASAIGTIYTAILALRFSSSGSSAGSTSSPIPFPLTGIIPALFLGAAIFLAIFYLAYLRLPPTTPAKQPPSGSPKGKLSGIASFRVIEQRKAFLLWTSAVVRRRLPCLHASIFSLGFGIVFLPIPFVAISAIVVWIAAVVCWALVIAFSTLLFPTMDTGTGEGN